MNLRDISNAELVAAGLTPAPVAVTCAHCGRTCGDYDGGTASLNGEPLCHPNAPGRPDCYSNVTVRMHPLRDCAWCSPSGGAKITKEAA